MPATRRASRHDASFGRLGRWRASRFSCSRSSPARARRARISNRAERLWCDFARLHGARAWCERRAPSGRRPRHAPRVREPPPASGRPGSARPSPRSLWRVVCRPGPPPALLHKAWFVESLRARTALDLAPFAVVPRAPLTTVQPEATRPIDAETPRSHRNAPRRVSARPSRPRARVRDALDAGDARHERRLARTSRLDVEGCVDGCYRDELTRARASVLEHAASLKTHDETRRFVAEGFPGFVGRTHRCAVAAELGVSSASDDGRARRTRGRTRGVGTGGRRRNERRNEAAAFAHAVHLDATVS